MSGIGNIPSDPQDPFAFAMNNMPRSSLPSSSNARSQGGSVSGAGITKRQSRPTRQTANQFRGFDVDLTGMDYATGSPSTMSFSGSSLNTSMDPAPLPSGLYDPRAGVGGAMQQNPQRQDYRNMSPVPKFENPDNPSTPDLVSPSQYESFAEEERETKPDPRRIRNLEGTPTPAHRRRRSSLAQTDISPATANTNSSPANNSFQSPGQASGSSTGGMQAAQLNPGQHQAHVPPNRIAEAGPVTHPDPEWRPYGVNHWHVFLTEPTTLKYLSSTEIKDIRDHCYELANKAAAATTDEDGEDEQPVPVAEGSAYTTADAQAVWRHCDAYVRRRSQVRNNQAARRSRQRKDAETRYWKAKALEYGAPDHEFNWDLVEESPPGQGSSSTAENAGQTRARSRAQQAQAQGQRRGEGHGQGARIGGRQGQAGSRRASGPSAAEPDFDFNQPLDYDEDDKSHNGGLDAFTGGF